MDTISVKGVGEFAMCSDHWECAPLALGESTLNIESAEISPEQESRAQYICSNWAAIVSQCLAYVELRRVDYKLEADSLTDPNVFINSGEEWSVYFDTELEFEAIVGVEFNGNQPFQLVIGD